MSRARIAGWTSLVLALAVPLARADVYTWVDAHGVVTVSNLQPPEDVRVTRVTKEAPPRPAARRDLSREAVREAELQALDERVRQLEAEVDMARAPAVTAPPVIAYVPVPTPVPTPVLMSYPVASPAPVPACDPSWYGCWSGSFWPLAPTVVVVSSSRTRAPVAAHRLRTFVPDRPWNGAPAISPIRPPGPLWTPPSSLSVAVRPPHRPRG